MNSIQSWPSSFFWKKCWEIAFKQISTEMYKIWRLGLLSRAAMVRGDSTAIECPSRWSSTERRLADLNLWQIIKPFEKEFELYSRIQWQNQTHKLNFESVEKTCTGDAGITARCGDGGGVASSSKHSASSPKPSSSDSNKFSSSEGTISSSASPASY